MPPKSRANIDDILDAIQPLTNVDTHAKLLIYGPSGVGKTVEACKIGTKILYVDSLEGWVSLKNHPELEKKVQRLPYQGISQLDMICDNWDDKFAGRFDTLILDEHSTMSALDLDVVLAARSAKDASKDPNVPTQPDFFANTERMRRSAAKLLKLPCNVVFITHEREDDDSGRKLIRASYSPKLRTTIKEFMHLIGRLTVVEKGDSTVRKLQVQPTLKIDAKTRIGGLPAIIENPDLGEIIRNWQNTGGPLDEPTIEIPKEPDAPTVEIETPNTELEI